MNKLIIIDCIYFHKFIRTIQHICIKNNINAIISSEINPCSEDFYLFLNLRDQKILPLNYIVYNFEQLQACNLSQDFYDNMKMAKLVLDYSINNVNYLLTRDIVAHFLPYSWFPTIKDVKKYIDFSDRINSFIFIGLFNERRKNLLRPIHTLAKDRSMNMFISNKCWNNDLSHHMSISKITFNIHYYEDNTILEVHRIIPCIFNKVIVITERSNDEYYDNMLNGSVTWIDENYSIEEATNDVLSLSDDEINKILNDRCTNLIRKSDSYSVELRKLLPLLTNTISNG